MDEDIVILIDRKLNKALRKIDESVSSHILMEWKEISAAPSCSTTSNVMKNINKVIKEGLNERNTTIKEILNNIPDELKFKLKKPLINEILIVVKNYYPDNIYVSLAEKTKKVFDHKNAPKNKFNLRVYNIEMAIIKGSAASSALVTIDEAKTNLIEMLLINESKKQNIREMFSPTMKWISGILAAVITTVIIAWLNIECRKSSSNLA